MQSLLTSCTSSVSTEEMQGHLNQHSLIAETDACSHNMLQRAVGGYLCCRVLYFEESQNGGPVICYSYVSNVIHQHLQRHASSISDHAPITLQNTGLTAHTHDLVCESCYCTNLMEKVPCLVPQGLASSLQCSPLQQLP